jgi:hypothetical protein
LYLLSGAQKVQGQHVELSLPLLPMLEVQEQNARHDIVTLPRPDSMIAPTMNQFGSELVSKFPRGHVSLFNAKLIVTIV